MAHKIAKLSAKADLAREEALAAAHNARIEAEKIADAKHALALEAACAYASELGIRKAEGSASLTELSFDYQYKVATGDLRRGDNVAIYNAYADSHDKRAAEKPAYGLKAFSKATRDSGINNLLTFSDPFVIHQALYSEPTQGLYDRIVKIRDKMEADELAPGSALSHFVRVNRAIGKRAEETAASIPPESFELTDADITAMLSKDPTVVKTDSRRLQDIIDAMKKFEKRNPEIYAEIVGAMRTVRTVAASLVLAETKAENEREAQAEREAIEAAEREEAETQRILAEAAARAEEEKRAA